MRAIFPIYLEKIDSTHLFAKRNLRRWSPSFVTRIQAMHQIGGIGQRGRKWVSFHGKSLCVTYVVFLKKAPVDRENIGQVLSLLAGAFLRRKGVAAQLKWPNDLFVGKRKIGGTLCEWVEKPPFLVGIFSLGCNVNLSLEDTAQIDQPATSILCETGNCHSIWKMAALFDLFFLAGFRKYIKEGFKSFYFSYLHSLIDAKLASPYV